MLDVDAGFQLFNVSSRTAADKGYRLWVICYSNLHRKALIALVVTLHASRFTFHDSTVLGSLIRISPARA
jgi:hypothetical protein